MKTESEEARLIENKSNSSSMTYTDGPKAPAAGSTTSSTASTAPPPYEKTSTNGVSRDEDNTARKSSSGCRSEQSQDSEINELMNYNGTTLMTQFHADALKQVGYGKYHWLMTFGVGLAFGAQAVHLFSLFFILPSADLEFCMVNGQKEFLMTINLMGTAFGATHAGSLAEINGRKKTLLSCLLCMTLFSVVSAFMPTYGTFGVAVFCALTCAGGIFPVGATYLCEMTPGNMRGRSISIFTAIGLGGGAIAAAGSILMLPLSGEEIILEHREHFSAWHRYLLVMTLSTVIPIFGMMMLPESPRWLLDVGREIEALEIYQKIYCANRTDGVYTLTELELPGMRSERHTSPKSVLTVMANNVYQFLDSFGSLLRPPYKKTTCILVTIWFFALFFGFGLTVYALNFGRTLEKDLFDARTVTIFNNTFENMSFTLNIVNQHFLNCQFVNCTFEQMFLSYVQFQNCSLLDTNFHGVKAGKTNFFNTFFNYVKFIDTDLTEENFINCVKNNTEFNQMTTGCKQQFDLNTFSEVDYHANLGWIVPSLIAVLWSGVVINRLGRVRMATLCLTLATILCCLVGFLSIGEPIYWIVGIVQAAIISALVALTIFATEYYCTYLRCTILGVCLCLGNFGAFLGWRLYAHLPVGDSHIVAVISIAGLSFPSILSTFLKETTQLL